MSSSTTPRRELLLDRTFLVGVILKGLDGLVDVIVGAPLLVMTRAQVIAIGTKTRCVSLRPRPRTSR